MDDPYKTMKDARARARDGEFNIGDVLMKRYEILAKLGQGGMGVVYKCMDRTSGIEVALKALPPELSHNTIEMADIKENFQLVHTLHHSRIASSNNLENDKANGNYYLIMEYCQGEDLYTWLKQKHREGSVTLDTVIPIVRQIAEALDYAHNECKIIHRDIKPANVMIDSLGKIKVLDFGLAAQIHTSMTRVSMAYHGTSGTGPYMAPEQWRGKKQGAASDQYALAVMTYQLLTGDLPFESADPAVLQQAILTQEADEIPGIPAYANQAIRRAMSKEPAERFESCADFVAALEGKNGKGATSSGGSNNVWKYLAVSAITALAVIAVVAVIRSGERPSSYGNTSQPATGKNSSSSFNSPAPERSAEFDGVVKYDDMRLEMVKIKAGTFMMGSPPWEYGRSSGETQHRVTLTKDYWLGKYEVKQAQWRAVMENNPSYYKGDDRPVEQVSWHEAKEFCKKLNERYAGKLPAGYQFDLPTEAQWEYACRAGTRTAFSYGDASDTGKMNFDGNFPYGGGSEGVYRRHTVDVGSLGYKNAWGLYDMHGNVREWCRDGGRTYSSDAVTDPAGPLDGSHRVIRGGDWNYYAGDCRSAYRHNYSPGDRFNYLGFRLALVPVQ